MCWSPLGLPHAPSLVEANARAVFQYLARAGAKAVVWLSGHGGTEDYLALRKAALHTMQTSGLVVWAGADHQLLCDLPRPMDHGAAIETSLMMHLEPQSVDLSALDPDPSVAPQGLGGADPRTQASAEFGAQRTGLLVDRLAALVRRLVPLQQDDPVGVRRHQECLTLQVAVEELVVYARAHLSGGPGKAPAGYNEHLQAFQRATMSRR